MIRKAILLLLLIASSKSGFIPAPIPIIFLRNSAPNYSFSYDVNDVVSGDIKSQSETRTGDFTSGHYSLIQPDGIQRTVLYTADDYNGFKVNIDNRKIAGFQYGLGDQYIRQNEPYRTKEVFNSDKIEENRNLNDKLSSRHQELRQIDIINERTPNLEERRQAFEGGKEELRSPITQKPDTEEPIAAKTVDGKKNLK